jgi:hypothetical protein
MKKSFKHWTRDRLYWEIGLTQNANMIELSYWLHKEMTIPTLENETILLELWRENANCWIDSWNEVELQSKFITKILDLAAFDLPEMNCNSFCKRFIIGSFQHLKFYEVADWMVAKGVTKPLQPYFILRRYNFNPKYDGRGELLATMLAAQAITNDNLPIYGCFVHERMWFFIVLKNLKYEISRAYIATQSDDLQEIVKILKQQKKMILERIQK